MKYEIQKIKCKTKTKREGEKIRAVVIEGRFSALGNVHFFRELLCVKV